MLTADVEVVDIEFVFIAEPSTGRSPHFGFLWNHGGAPNGYSKVIVCQSLRFLLILQDIQWGGRLFQGIRSFTHIGEILTIFDAVLSPCVGPFNNVLWKVN